jgi:hypothetical protein
VRNRVSFQRVSTVLMVLAGLLTQAACGGQTGSAPPAASDLGSPSPVSPSASSPTASASSSSPVTSSPTPSRSEATKPSSGGTTAKTGVFSGKRQVYLLPRNSEATFALDKAGRMTLSEDFGDRALFVLTPVRDDKFWIRTAKVRSGGEALCVTVKGKSVVTAGCDTTTESQLFRFRRTGESNGKPTYTIRTGKDIYLVQDPDGKLGNTGTGVAAVQIGEGTPDIDTPFVLPDRGKATLPALD